ncbi:2Fe-2S iron-sulfur cluster binding domain-containing protein [Zobellella maritima]|uniref:2Fe-2S iron-sulfur cluster binding domain-containing protein n=1 Tax=Zobellella maritima TaxID=2059725 RepID=UPI000E304B78|nr:2Fe-2S iron-sulfur cluster binding domain-containing protein [Zobellella maritima]
MHSYTITLHREGQPPAAFTVQSGQSLLVGAEADPRRPVPVGCRGGGCGLCRVRILTGDYQRGRMSRTYISARDAQQGYALACRVLPLTDMDIMPAPLTVPAPAIPPKETA